MREEASTGREQGHAPRRAREERRAELVFERPNLSGQRRLRDVKSLGGTPQVSFFRDDHEVFELREAHDAGVYAKRTSPHILDFTPSGSCAPIPNRYGRASPPTRTFRSMSAERHGPRAIARLRAAGTVAAATLAWVGAHVRPGLSTAELDRLVRDDTRRRGARPSQLGYHGFPGAVCTSRNDVACHGVPREDDVLEAGDVVSIDVTSELDGYHGDTCATFFVGEPSPEARHVVEVARRCRDAGIAAVRDGVRTGELGHAMHEAARREGCDVVRIVGGHGIGRKMHEPPHVPFFGEPGEGRRVRADTAITIEPIVVLGSPELVEAADGWTLRTADGRWAAQFEHTVLVTRKGCEILTLA